MQSAIEAEAYDGYEDETYDVYDDAYPYADSPRLALPWTLGLPNLTAVTAVFGLVAGFVLWGALALVVIGGLQSISTPVTAAELLAGESAVDCARLETEPGRSNAEQVLFDTTCEPELATEPQ